MVNIQIPILVPRHRAELALRSSMLLPLGTAVASLMAALLYHRQMSLLPMNCELMALLSDMRSTLCNDQSLMDTFQPIARVLRPISIEALLHIIKQATGEAPPCGLVRGL